MKITAIKRISLSGVVKPLLAVIVVVIGCTCCCGVNWSLIAQAPNSDLIVYSPDDSDAKSLLKDNETKTLLDTVLKLNEVEVTARRPAEDIIPAQTLSGAELRRLNSNSVADAMRYFAGVQVKDYGGVGGIKTVNVRSMGTNHTGVVYDGVALGNAQNGQIDLGQFSLDNMEELSLYNGQKSRILQPAKDFGNAGTIYLRTRTPNFEEGESYHFRATFRTGSFDLVNPSALVELKLSDHVNASLAAEWVNSSGKYKFRYRRVNPNGSTAYDTTAVRRNGDINATRLELNLNGTFSKGSWSIKGYNYNSERGIPGAIVNNVWRRGERLWDNNSFLQARSTYHNGRWTMLNHLKYAFYKTHYVNNDDRTLKVDNLYRQNEAYLSTAHEVALTDFWEVSGSYDFQWNGLHTDLVGFRPTNRYSNFLSAATSLDFIRIKLQASVLATLIHDRVGEDGSNDGNSNNHSRITPSVFLSLYPLNNKDLSVRAFYKNSFRMPTFNDLYYTEIGNASLKPERVSQYNLGIVYEHSSRGLWNTLRLSCDAYYNRVTDKIVAYPKGAQFRWTMLNLGKVDIRGLDLNAAFTINPLQDLLITLRGQYTFQRAIDVTNPTDSYYRDQIPYIPRHSGSVVANLQWKGWGANYSWIYVGERYSQQDNILYNRLQPWYTSDLSVSKDLHISRTNCRILLEINNLLSQDYDVIANYPMPKRNFRLTLTVEM